MVGHLAAVDKWLAVTSAVSTNLEPSDLMLIPCLEGEWAGKWYPWSRHIPCFASVFCNSMMYRKPLKAVAFSNKCLMNGIRGIQNLLAECPSSQQQQQQQQQRPINGL